MKECSICKQVKELSNFYSQSKTKKDGTSYTYYNPYCIDCAIRKSGKWQKNNKDKKNKSNSKYMNSKVGREVRRKYQKRIRKEGKQTEWQRENKDKVREYRIKKEHQTHKISTEEWKKCKEYFNHQCAYCRLELSKHYIVYKGIKKLGDFHKDHFRHDGCNDISNCIPSCKECNTSKKDKVFEDWYIEHEKYSEENVLKIYKWINEDCLSEVTHEPIQ